MTLSRHLIEVRLAFMMLTRLPVGRLGEDAPTLAQAAWAFPLVGLVVGAIGWGVFVGALALGTPALVAALLVVTVSALVIGGLHHDGLADFADGIGGGRDKDHCLEIMRDSRIGSYGVLALILAVGLQAAALAGATPSLAAFLFIGVGSRLAMVVLMVLLPSARADGLGHMASKPNPWSVAPGGAVLAVLWVLLWPGSFGLDIALALATGLVAWAALRRIGGQTGDVLGATQLTSEVTAWVVFSALSSN